MERARVFVNERVQILYLTHLHHVPCTHVQNVRIEKYIEYMYLTLNTHYSFAAKYLTGNESFSLSEWNVSEQMGKNK